MKKKCAAPPATKKPAAKGKAKAKTAAPKSAWQGVSDQMLGGPMMGGR